MQIQRQNRFAKLDLYGVKLAVVGMQEQEQGTRSFEHAQPRLGLAEHEELAQHAGGRPDGVPGTSQRTMISMWRVQNVGG